MNTSDQGQNFSLVSAMDDRNRNKTIIIFFHIHRKAMSTSLDSSGRSSRRKLVELFNWP